MFFKYVIIIILASVCLYTDIKYKKVKNKVLLIFALAGLVFNIVFYGIYGLENSLLASLIPFFLLFLLYAIRIMGAGDIKLFSVIGIIGGVNFILNNMLFSFAAAGIISAFIMVIRKNFIKRIKYFFYYLIRFALSRKVVPYSDFKDDKRGDKFQFVYGIFIGTIIQIIFKEIASLSFI
ncbi:prepilin peptidase [Clostridium sp. 19966]|uniref:A24 family peptidase n=1 Tax=Clostridium sp. 19966 TaxID=2768166 RepID=UPI0028DEC9D9|nr:prepilin peptidase [Clostridium sp. 19966]MDT8718578.1 prepilin peptidase [Clostridium sp. 19966]